MAQLAPTNAETHEAWNGVLFDRFVKYRPLVTTGLGSHGEQALRIHPPKSGDRVLDVGCGFGDTAQRIAELVGPGGSVLGVDVAERFIETAQQETEQAGATNVSFEVADVQVKRFEQTFDYAFSRFGTMFFASPVPALRNVREALEPGGRLCMVVWRRKLDNDWLHRAELVVKDLVEEQPDSDEPTCGPGPFSMANADTVSDILLNAGFEQIELGRCDIDIKVGENLEEAIELMTALGPAGEAIRLAGPEQAERAREEIEQKLRVALAEFVKPDGTVSAPASTWIVSARSAGS